MAQVFLNPLEDSGFKILFRKKRNMVGLLETILDRKIHDLEYIDTEQIGVTIDETNSRFDLAVQFADGSTCVVEMQRACLEYFNYRSVFYASHLVQRQATLEHDRQFDRLRSAGKKPFWNYRFDPVYFVGILENGWGNICLDGGPLLERYRLKEISSGEDMKVDYNFLFLRLDRFHKKERECGTLLERFAYSMKNMSGESSKPESFSEEWLMNLYDDAFLANLPADIAHELLLSKSMTTENDWLVAINEAEERATRIGLAKGMEKGREEGRAEGLEEGRAEGREEGRKAEKLEIAAQMKLIGISSEQIVRSTGLSAEEVAAL